MKISDIDKDFEDIVYYLDNMGFKPFASCDGVEANHKGHKDVNLAYIDFLRSSKITHLMAAFLRDKENFIVSLESETHFKPYEKYGNIISGTTYQVYFQNRNSENTAYFENIIRTIAEEKEVVSSDEKRNLDMLDKVLEENSDSDLSFRVTFNGNYTPAMGKNGMINELTITTKVEEGRVEGNIWIKTERDMEILADILSKKYNIPRRIDSFEEEYPETEFIMSRFDRISCSIYFTDEHLPQILEQIQYIREIAHTLPAFESREWIGSDEELYGEDYDKIWETEDTGDELFEWYSGNELDENTVTDEQNTPLQQREQKLAMLEQEEAELLNEEQLIPGIREEDDPNIEK